MVHFIVSLVSESMSQLTGNGKHSNRVRLFFRFFVILPRNIVIASRYEIVRAFTIYAGPLFGDIHTSPSTIERKRGISTNRGSSLTQLFRFLGQKRTKIDFILIKPCSYHSPCLHINIFFSHYSPYYYHYYLQRIQ